MAPKLRVLAAAAALMVTLAGCASTVTGVGTAVGPGAAAGTGDFPSTPVPTGPATTAAATPATTAAPSAAASTTAATPSTQPAGATSAAPDGAGQTPYLSKFVGQWIGHGRVLTIRSDGTGTLIYRAYKNCSDDPTPPCDKIVNNQIVDGGRLTFKILQTIADSGNYGAEVQILTANDPAINKSQPGGMSLDTHDVITTEFFNESTFCGPKAAAGACGA